MELKTGEQIAINSFWNFLVVLFARLGGLFFIIIIARFLMPEGFGIYNLVISLALIFLVTVDTGANRSLLRYVADAIGKKDYKLARANFNYLFKLKLYLTLSISIGLIILSYPLSFYLFKKPELFLPLIFTSLYILSYSFGSFYNTCFYIIKKVNYVTIKEFLFEVARNLGVLLVFFLVAKEYYVIGTIGVLALTMFLAALFLIYNLRKLSPFLFEKSDLTPDKKRIFRFFLYLGAIGSFLVIFGYVDTIMIGIFLDISYVGFYAAALTLTGSLWSFLNISQILLPIFTQMKEHDLESAFNNVYKYLAILAIPAIFGIFVLGKPFIRAIYGPEYLPAVLPFYILSILILEVPLISIVESLFSAVEKPKYIMKIIIIATIMNIILNFVLIKSLLTISPEMAIIGAAMASLTSQTFYLFGLLFYAKRKLNINLKFAQTLKPIIASLGMILVLFSINHYVTLNIYYAIVEVFLGASIYFILMFLIKGITKQDLNLLRSIKGDITKNHKDSDKTSFSL